MAKDPLDQPISADFSVSEKGANIKLRIRAAAAFDRLIGAGFDNLAARIEHNTDKKRAGSKKEIAAIEAIGDNVTELALNDKDFAHIAYQRLKAREVRKAINLHNVIEKTKELNLEPFPEVDASENEKEVNPDWLNAFEIYAENASTERMQVLFAKILAREIRKTETFSLATLRFCSELDQSVASVFEKYARDAIMQRFLLQSDFDKLTNEDLFNASMLEEVGLVGDIKMGMQLKLEVKDGYCSLIHSGLLLRFKPISAENRSIKLVNLTKIGRELSMLVEPNDPRAVLKKLGMTLLERSDSCEIYAPYPNGALNEWYLLEKLK